MWVFGRDEEAKNIWSEVADGKNLLLLAPRRVGKTHLQHLLTQQAPNHRYRAIWLDVEGFGAEKDFLSQLCSAIQEELSTGSQLISSLTHRLNNVLKGRSDGEKDWRGWLLSTDWKDFAEQLLSQLEEDKSGHDWLILIDELPIFIQELQRQSGVDAVGIFLYWLRRARQKYKSIRWILAGSIGLDTVARQFGFEGALNDLVPIGLQPFSEEVAKKFLAEIAKKDGKSFSNEALDQVVERLGWLSPYYLERIAKTTCSSSPSGREMQKDDVSASMDLLLELPNRLYWASWRDHLDRNFRDDTRLSLYLMLAEMSKRRNGCTKDHLIATLTSSGIQEALSVVRNGLDALENDGFVSKTGNSYRFRMNLLREWWLRYVITD
jgi:uncharacterized protein